MWTIKAKQHQQTVPAEHHLYKKKKTIKWGGNDSNFQIQFCTCLFSALPVRSSNRSHCFLNMHLRTCALDVACGEVEWVEAAGQHTDCEALQHYTTLAAADLCSPEKHLTNPLFYQPNQISCRGGRSDIDLRVAVAIVWTLTLPKTDSVWTTAKQTAAVHLGLFQCIITQCKTTQ